MAVVEVPDTLIERKRVDWSFGAVLDPIKIRTAIEDLI